MYTQTSYVYSDTWTPAPPDLTLEDSEHSDMGTPQPDPGGLRHLDPRKTPNLTLEDSDTWSLGTPGLTLGDSDT